MSYRNDLEAQALLREGLEQRLTEVRRRIGELEPLRQQAAELEQHIEDTRRDAAAARAKMPLPILGQVRVASPCKESWDEMVGDDHVRHCQRCDKNVYDLSSLTREQAEALLSERGQEMCVRFYRRADGTVLTSDCPVGSRRKRIGRTAAGIAAGVISAAVAAGATVTMGDAQMGEYLSTSAIKAVPLVHHEEFPTERIGRASIHRESPVVDE